MNKQQKKLVKENILEARALLEADIADRLIRYGLNKDPAKWLAEDKIKHLSLEELQVRKNIIAAIAKLEQGMSKKEAVEQYIKEVVFTFVNRIAALRVLEVRQIIPEILETKAEYDNRSQVYRDFSEVAGELCSGADKGWQVLLNLVFEEISTEIKVLFDPKNEFSLVFPSNQAVAEIMGLFTEIITKDIWQEDEIIGWIYQYFNSKEKDEVFENLYKNKIKINSRTLPAATQLFTPKWIVKYLIDNTLGAYWIEMNPKSDIATHCTYIIKNDNPTERSLKKVSEIKLLDPACGSGHFLLQAFDVFYKMYEEEGIVAKSDIPSTIIANNLYGIDIDLRAVQLTALTLFVKAKTYNKHAKITKMNAVAADAILKDDNNKERLIVKLKSKLPGADKLVETIWDSFKNIREYGSLLRIETEIKKVLEEEKNKLGKEQLHLSNFGATKKGQQTMHEVMSSEQYWQSVEDSIINEVQQIAKESLKVTDISQSMFAAEAEKTMHLLDFFFQRYDIVVTNPPYMGKKGMGENLKKYLKMNYPKRDMDMYSAFIDRCMEFSCEDGYIGMITQDTFMFISTFQQLRKDILEETRIKSFVHLGPHAFEEIKGEKVRSAMFSLTKNKSTQQSIFVRLTNTFDKEKLFLESIKNREYFIVKQEMFNSIEDSPFAYWISKEVLDLFNKLKPLRDVATPKAGMQTGDNEKYIRFKWEIDIGKSTRKWYPYNKGKGASKRFFDESETLIDWDEESILQEPGNAIRNKEFFFVEAISFTLISGTFDARYLSEGHISDMGTPYIILKEPNKIYYLLGLLNSKFSTYILRILNPTVNFQVGDVERIPYIEPKQSDNQVIENEVKNIIKKIQTSLCYDERSSFFKLELTSKSLNDTVREKVRNYENLQYNLLKSQKLIDDFVFNIYRGL